MTSDDIIDYDSLQQEALRGLVRNVLLDVAKNGLPGQHHFYISYDVRSLGVGLSKRLREKYPGEMTIVLQHRFWDLIVGEDRFEVKLTFDGIPERLVVPFAAIKVFLDPSVKFIVHFDDSALLADREHGPSSGSGAGAGDGRPGSPARKRVSRAKPRPDRPSGPPALTLASLDSGTERRLPAPKTPALIGPASSRRPGDGRIVVDSSVEGRSGPSPINASNAASETPAPVETDGSDPADTAGQKSAATPGSAGAQVVSLDAFRKK